MAQRFLVIFDCDGVLVDSEAITKEVALELLAQSGITIAPETYTANYLGLPFRETVQKIEAERHVSLPADIVEQSKARVAERLRSDLEAIAGAQVAVELAGNVVLDAVRALHLERSRGTHTHGGLTRHRSNL